MKKAYSEIADIVYRVISRFKADETLEPKLRTSRPPMTTKQEDQMIVKMSFSYSNVYFSYILWANRKANL